MSVLDLDGIQKLTPEIGRRRPGAGDRDPDVIVVVDLVDAGDVVDVVRATLSIVYTGTPPARVSE